MYSVFLFDSLKTKQTITGLKGEYFDYRYVILTFYPDSLSLNNILKLYTKSIKWTPDCIVLMGFTNIIGPIKIHFAATLPKRSWSQHNILFLNYEI